MIRFQPPLQVYVHWRRTFGAGADVFRHIFKVLNRDLDEPESRGMGIPVFGRSDVLASAFAPNAVPEAKKRARIILFDAGAADDDAWVVALRALLDGSTGDVLLPVLAQRTPLGEIDTRLGTMHAMDLSGEPVLATALERRVVHELARHLLARPRPPDAPSTPAPVRLFLSHAKRDGLGIARALKDEIERHSSADTFFDAHDITPGAPFPLEIFGSVEHCALIVAQTDAYASREWCRREVIEAKRQSRPVVVINAITIGEERGFPYLGNVPTIRWDFSQPDTVNAARALDLALRETLRAAYFHELWSALSAVLAPSADPLTLARPPELLLPTASTGSEQVVVYPDPPLGDEELQVLATHRSEIRPMTPLTTMWQAFGPGARPLENSTVSLSLSLPVGDELLRRGLDQQHVDDLAIESARYLLASGARLAYGGDLRGGGFTEKLVTLVHRHNRASGEPFHRLENYLAWHLHAGTAAAADVMSCRERRVDLPSDVPAAHKRPDSVIAKARGLTAMRETIILASSAHVVLGGATSQYEGRVPGVLEEMWLALERGLPLYVVGGFGGMAGAAADVMVGGAVASHALGPGKGYRVELDAALAGKRKEEGTDAAALLGSLSGRLTRLNNGLSEDENRALFSSVDVQDILVLVMTGLARLANAKGAP
jgi:SLOG cluster2/TIR domain